MNALMTATMYVTYEANLKMEEAVFVSAKFQIAVETAL
jgi:hypothetical protein